MAETGWLYPTDLCPWESTALEESTEKRRGFFRETNDLVRCLTIEFEIEFSPGTAVIPVGELLEVASSQGSLRERSTSDGNAHTRRLPGYAGFLRDRFD